MKKLTNTLRDSLVIVSAAFARGDNEKIDVGMDTLESFCAHGLIDYTPSVPAHAGGTWWLTEKGIGEVNLRTREQEEAKAARRKAGKSRYAAMTGLGLRRNLDGSYE